MPTDENRCCCTYILVYAHRHTHALVVTLASNSYLFWSNAGVGLACDYLVTHKIPTIRWCSEICVCFEMHDSLVMYMLIE